MSRPSFQWHFHFAASDGREGPWVCIELPDGSCYGGFVWDAVHEQGGRTAENHAIRGLRASALRYWLCRAPSELVKWERVNALLRVLDGERVESTQ